MKTIANPDHSPDNFIKTTLLISICLLVLLFFSNSIFAQPPANVCPSPGKNCSNTPYNGNLDLANPVTLYTIPDTPQRISYAKTPLNPNIGDVRYVYDEDYSGDCLPPADSMDQCSNDGSKLIYDVYYPDSSSYKNYLKCPLPVVILFHAGGFMECTNLELSDIVTVCRELAKRGFVVMSCDYRTGRIKAPGKYISVQQQLAVYRACQDARGAIRSIILRALKEGKFGVNAPYRIDIIKIFVGGFSAGGLVAMNASWYSNPMVYSIFQNGGGGSTIQQALGTIDADFYYGSKTELMDSLGHDYQANIIGNACMWGAVGIPPTYSNTNQYAFFDSTLLKPLISFQGKKDQVFPYDLGVKQNIYFSTVPAFNSTDFCINSSHGAYFLDTSAPSRDLVNGSTLNMRNILIHYKIADEHYVDPDMLHGFTTDTLGVFHGDFGTGVTNSTDACVYLAQRIATFFSGGIKYQCNECKCSQPRHQLFF